MKSIVLFGFFFPVVSAIQAYKKAKNISFGDNRDKSKGWGIFFIIWGALFFMTGVTPNADPNFGIGQRIVSILYFTLPSIFTGLFLMEYDKNVVKFNQNMNDAALLMKGGEQSILRIGEKIGLGENDTINIIQNLISSGLLSEYKIDLQTKRVYNAVEDANKQVVAWKCPSCSAQNKRLVKNGDVPVCEYCGAHYVQ